MGKVISAPPQSNQQVSISIIEALCEQPTVQHVVQCGLQVVHPGNGITIPATPNWYNKLLLCNVQLCHLHFNVAI